MEKYIKLIEEVRRAFPHSSDVVITVTTDKKDGDDFSSTIDEFSKTTFYIETDEPKPAYYTSFRNPFGMITLKLKDGE